MHSRNIDSMDRREPDPELGDRGAAGSGPPAPLLSNRVRSARNKHRTVERFNLLVVASGGMNVIHTARREKEGL
jgi:hypothetical protein